MSEKLGPQEDISALWGPQGNGLLTPAPRRAEQQPAERAINGHESNERVVALERDLRQQLADLTHRLERLEHQVVSLTESRRASLTRISKVLKGH